MSPVERKIKVCIVARKDLSRNTRIIRQARSLSERGHEVTVFALGLPLEASRLTTPDVRYCEVSLEPLSKSLTLLTRLLDGRTWIRLLVQTPRRLMHLCILFAKWLVDVSPIDEAKIREFLPGGQRQTGKPITPGVRDSEPSLAQRAMRSDGQPGKTSEPRPKGRERPWRSGLVMGLYGNLRDAAFARDASRLLAETPCDVLQLHDSHSLRVARQCPPKGGPALVYDAVEIPEDRSGWAAQRIPRIIRWYDARLTKTLVRRMDAVLTVSDGLRDWTARRYGVTPPTVVRNCRHYEDVTRPDWIRQDCRLSPDHRLVLYLNSLYGGQGLEQLVDSLAFLPPHIHVATLGPVAQPGYVEDLRRRADQLSVDGRLHILEPKPPTEMLEYASGADLGVIPRQNSSLNNFHSLPNRVFELIMARLPIAGPSLQDMRDFIEGNSLGLIFDETDPADIARTIQAMLDPNTFERLRTRIEDAAREFSWDREGERYATLIEQVSQRVAEQHRAHATGATSHSPSSVPST